MRKIWIKKTMQKEDKTVGIVAVILAMFSIIIVVIMPKISLICAIISSILAFVTHNKNWWVTVGKILGIIGIVISIYIICTNINNNIKDRDEKEKTENEIAEKMENVKYYSIPNWMKTQPKTQRDKELVDELLKKGEQKYGVKFNLIGIAKSEVEVGIEEDTGIIIAKDEVSIIYVFSDEYPEVYTSIEFDDEKNKIGYLEDVNAWKVRNYIYDKAQELGINTKLIGVDVWGHSDEATRISCDFLINKEISLESMRELADNMRKELNKDEIKFTIYTTETGNNKLYKENIINHVGINSNYIYSDFGNWNKYIILSNKEQTKCELNYSYVK